MNKLEEAKKEFERLQKEEKLFDEAMCLSKAEYEALSVEDKFLFHLISLGYFEMPSRNFVLEEAFPKELSEPQKHSMYLTAGNNDWFIFERLYDGIIYYKPVKVNAKYHVPYAVEDARIESLEMPFEFLVDDVKMTFSYQGAHVSVNGDGSFLSIDDSYYHLVQPVAPNEVEEVCKFLMKCRKPGYFVYDAKWQEVKSVK